MKYLPLLSQKTFGYSVENPWLGGNSGFESDTVAQAFDTPRQSIDEMCASMFIKVIAPSLVIGLVTREPVQGTPDNRVGDGDHGPLLPTAGREAMIQGR